MKPQKTLIALSLCSILSACGGSNSTTPTPTPTSPIATLTLVMPAHDAMMQEDFPIARHLTYMAGEQPIDSITSIDINWPAFDVYQANKELGYINGMSNELFYSAYQGFSAEIEAAEDLEKQAQQLWFVNGNNRLNKLDQSNNQLSSWALHTNATLTELAIDEEDTANIWLYNRNDHQLIHFNANTEQSTPYTLTADININGLSLVNGHLFILGEKTTEQIIFQYQVDNHTANHINSWYITGFDHDTFNDISVMPDDRIALSTTGIEANIYLVADRAAFLGDGPIADHGELDLVEQHALSDIINQPSGLWPTDNNGWLIITDQAEMFALDENYQITNSTRLTFDSINCNQGCTEAIVGSEAEFFALTDSGLVGQFTYIDDTYVLTQEHQINVLNEDGESYRYSGLSKNNETNEYYLVSDQNGANNEDVLIILNSDFSLKDQHTIHFNGETAGSIFEYDAQGVYYYDNHVYTVSELYTKVLKINLTGEIVAVIDLDHEDVEIPSDIAIKNGQIYLTGDHENDEPTPPVSVFEMVNF